MKTATLKNISILILLTILSACSTRNWYVGAQSAQTAQCLKEPAAEYEDCMQQSSESYDEYSKKREQLLKENQGKQVVGP
ncbi:MAG: hypothetical protein LJE83_07310 [Gammaproteobacteria bacterium]|jgi:pantothenate synthetase|nr:hypothetical protein [Gammaproteobacteria bacterium]